jgi:hypothetical protein
MMKVKVVEIGDQLLISLLIELNLGSISKSTTFSFKADSPPDLTL